MQERHRSELAEAGDTTKEAAEVPNGTGTDTANAPESNIGASTTVSAVTDSTSDANSKLERARRKREKQRAKERESQQALENELSNAGPSPRDIENDVIMQQLRPLNLKIEDVQADGHCLYRAVAAQCGKDYQAMRKWQSMFTSSVDALFVLFFDSPSMCILSGSISLLLSLLLLVLHR
jgi:OTU domain-containing protein 6